MLELGFLTNPPSSHNLYPHDKGSKYEAYVGHGYRPRLLWNRRSLHGSSVLLGCHRPQGFLARCRRCWHLGCFVGLLPRILAAYQFRNVNRAFPTIGGVWANKRSASSVGGSDGYAPTSWPTAGAKSVVRSAIKRKRRSVVDPRSLVKEPPSLQRRGFHIFRYLVGSGAGRY